MSDPKITVCCDCGEEYIIGEEGFNSGVCYECDAAMTDYNDFVEDGGLDYMEDVY